MVQNFNSRLRELYGTPCRRVGVVSVVPGNRMKNSTATQVEGGKWSLLGWVRARTLRYPCRWVGVAFGRREPVEKFLRDSGRRGQVVRVLAGMGSRENFTASLRRVGVGFDPSWGNRMKNSTATQIEGASGRLIPAEPAELNASPAAMLVRRATTKSSSDLVRVLIAWCPTKTWLLLSSSLKQQPFSRSARLSRSFSKRSINACRRPL